VINEVPVETTADAYLEMLTARGIEYFFGNGGTDFGPIVDAYARRITLEQPSPRPVTVPHEITGLAMAYGYTMVTGRPQVVMVHTIAGTANSVGGLISANRARIPMFFSAGRTPITEGPEIRGARNGGIHWGQESYDQGGMVREWVKWDYELRSDMDIEAVVDRALAISMTEPQGPVYLTLPREVMAEEREIFRYSDRPRMVPGATMPAPDGIESAARALAAARNPILITQALGRDPAAVAELVRLAEALNIPVFGNGTFMNFPTNHPLYQPGGAGPHLADADVIVVVESDVPWMPSSGMNAPEDATVIALDNDPLYENYPMRSFRADITLAGKPRLALAGIADAVAGLARDETAIEERGRHWAEAHESARAHALERAEAGRDKAPLDKAWVSRCFEPFVDENMIIVSELGLDNTQFDSTAPGTYFAASAAGVLGWALGASLGAKLAARDKTVVCCLGDGSYMFGVPSATHWISRDMDLPVLYVVWNNSRWNAVMNSTRAVYPDGWAVRENQWVFSDLNPSLDFEMICQSAGGYAERVEDPNEVGAAFERALHAVRVEGRQALLNIIAG
jgi:acetolactate synthase I/II/III large subunit